MDNLMLTGQTEVPPGLSDSTLNKQKRKSQTVRLTGPTGRYCCFDGRVSAYRETASCCSVSPVMRI
ncbi:MAG TPA: hypothetical protein VKM36_08630 [Balneolaceae bacterium]|nr:hypothetical protein [Balneolaceae bacterium]